jgi:hypothetical protein
VNARPPGPAWAPAAGRGKIVRPRAPHTRKRTPLKIGCPMPKFSGVQSHSGPRVMVGHHRSGRTYFVFLKRSVEGKLLEQGDEVPGLRRYGEVFWTRGLLCGSAHCGGTGRKLLGGLNVSHSVVASRFIQTPPIIFFDFSLGGVAKSHESQGEPHMDDAVVSAQGSVPAVDLRTKRDGQGILWVNSSHEHFRYIREAEKSAKTVRRFVKGAELVSVSDRYHPDLDPVFDFQACADFSLPECLRADFHGVARMHFNGQMVAKLGVLKHMTWERNLYLGSDIAALRPAIEEIFGLLDDFDLVVAHAPGRISFASEEDETLRQIPKCFPEMNCDLVAYRRSDAMGQLLTEWERIYCSNEINHWHDQGAFRYLVLKSRVRFYILPPEYNYRGSDFPVPKTAILQTREMIPTYARHFAHIYEIYGPLGILDRLAHRSLRSRGRIGTIAKSSITMSWYLMKARRRFWKLLYAVRRRFR